MFRNIDQRNNLVLLLTSVVLLKGSLSEHIWDEVSVWCRWWWEHSLTY